MTRKPIIFLAICGLVLAGTCLGQAEWPDKDKYDRLVGKWRYDIESKANPDSEWQKSSEEVEFAWTLGGAFYQIKGEGQGYSFVEIIGYDPLQKTGYSSGFNSYGWHWRVTSSNYSGSAITTNWTSYSPEGQMVPGRCVWKNNADYTAGTGECHSFTDGKWWHQRKIKTTRIK